ncbi:MAG: glycosyltransferase family 4 protein [Gammaproteobacteria bacterium]
MSQTGQPTIGILAKVFPKLSESFILEEVLGLERLGVQLRILALEGPDPHPMHARAREVKAPLCQLPPRRLQRWAVLTTAQVRQWLRSPRKSLRVLLESRRLHGAGWRRKYARAVWLVEVCRRHGIDRLHVHFASEPTEIADLAHRLHGIPFSVSGHAKDIWCCEPALLRQRLARACFIATCTRANAEYLAHDVAAPVSVHRVYHGIDTSLFTPPARRADGRAPLVLAVGRLRPKKGFATLLHALRLLKEGGHPVRCAIVGYGPDLETLQCLVDTLDMRGSVEFPGPLPHERLIEWYRQADVFCSPCEVQDDGDRDGIPNVMLEAMATALPVIATPVSGIPEVVQHDRNGWLVPPRDPAALAEAIAHLLGQPSLGARLGRAARETVLTMFDSQRNLATLAALLQGASVDPGAGDAVDAR